MTSSARRLCTGAILAGGAAKRMGSQAKGLLRVGGLRIVDRVALALAEATDGLVIAADDPAAIDWLPGVPVIADRRAGLGPLGGLHAALVATRGDVLALAWDMPYVPAELLRALRDAGEMEGATIVAPKSRGPWGFEPLCAWYSTDALPLIEAQLDAGDLRAGTLGAHAEVLTVDVSSWGDVGDLFLSVNTPEDLARAEALASRTRPQSTDHTPQ